MTRALCALALLALLLTSCAATLAVRGTAPTLGAEGSCARSIPADTLRGPLRVVARVEGIGLMDSLWAVPGEAFAFRWQVPPGSYVVTAFARNAGGVSCSTSVVVTTTSRPSPVAIR